MFEIKTPVHINTEFNYFCDGCEVSDLALRHNTVYANGEEYQHYYILTCENLERCRRLMHRLKNQKEEDSK